MSLLDEIEQLCKEGRLIHLKQTFPEFAEKRTCYITPGMANLLEGPWETATWEKRWYRARQYLDDFIDGVRFTVRSEPRKKSTCDISLLDPSVNEIWEMRCRDSKPGLRIFGSFAKKDVFVALTCAPHECLGIESDWNEAIQHFKQEWPPISVTRPSQDITPMSTFRKPSFLTEIVEGEQIPIGKLEYFRERLKSRLHQLVLDEYLRREDRGFSQTDLARRIGKRADQISRLLGTSGNWTLNTVSDLLIGMESELDFTVIAVADRAKQASSQTRPVNTLNDMASPPLANTSSQSSAVSGLAAFVGR